MCNTGQAIREIANTYAESGKFDLAEKWVTKSRKTLSLLKNLMSTEKKNVY